MNVELQTKKEGGAVQPFLERGPMIRTKLPALKFALLLGTVSILLSGCFVFRGDDRDRNARPGYGSDAERQHDDRDQHENGDHP